MNFLFQPYRETLMIKNSSLLRKEVQYLAEKHGQYCRLFKRKVGEIEAVFSQEPGYAFGETVWHYFEESPYLIYCEKISTESHKPEFLLVVVRKGIVFLDTKIAAENLTDELKNSLVSDRQHYKVYLSGEIPFAFEGVASVKRLDKPVSVSLVWDSAFQLLPVFDALREHHLEDKTRASLAMVTVLCVAVLGVLWWHFSQTKPKINVNPYEQYELSLQTPSPSSETTAFVKALRKMITIPGWEVVSAEFSGQVGEAKLKSVGGSATQLLTISQSQGMSVRFASTGVYLHFSSALTHRTLPDSITNAEKTVAVVMDRMNSVLPKKSVVVDQAKTNQVFKQIDITISFNNISPDVLQLMGSKLDDLPVNVNAISVNVKNGVLSGYIKISVVGN